ncbi:ammonium transporter [Marinobacter sp. ELB17]|uniref:ammonium transporter n=1 Tax=Marinobacter sp. ELB17 TaxID=270374 RepID=UPI0000F38181|nr:ammonium transporter [Marinobacter sp. ELB17]EAZ99955.1 diguanylate cyclase/phosphodiesterase (GGDEF & EAL domains) with PAS/PAC sensor(s) [Marinobacter sp. ELB17]
MSEKEAIDVLWLILAGILVLTMQAGFLCLESGLTRSKNAINVALKNAFDLLVVMAVYWFIGFNLMFGEHSAWALDWRWVATDFSQLDFWDAGFFFFQMTFCATAATIVSGAIAERSRFITYVLVTILIAGVIYPVVGHWSWSGIFNGSNGWLQQKGFVDFAGSSVVHGVGGWVALAAVIVIGPRQGRFKDGQVREISGSNLPMAMLGLMFFIIGWLGFNGGSVLAFDARVPGIMVNTLMAAATGGMVALLISYCLSGRHRVTTMTINGTLAGLVAITAGVHSVSTLAAMVIGALGCLCMLAAEQLLLKFELDDPVGAVPVHLVAGIWGTLAVAFFGRAEQLQTGLSFSGQLQAQLFGIVAIGLFSFSLALVFLWLLKQLMPLRVSAEGERDGLNVSEHGARTELVDLLQAMAGQEKSGDLQHKVHAEPFTEVGLIAAQYNRVMARLNQVITRTRLIVRDIRDGVITFNSKGIISSVNPGAEHLFARSRAQLIGQSTALLLHRNNSALYTHANPEQVFPRLAASENVGPHELIARGADDQPFYIEVTTAASPTEAGVQYSAVIRDISERKRIEEQLHRHSELAQVTLEAITEGVITFDAQMHTVYLNPIAAALTGWSSQQAFGKPAEHILCLKSIEGDNMAVLPLFQQQKKQCLQLIKKGGKFSDIELTPAPLHNHAGEPVGWVVVMQDVTNSKLLQQQLSFQAIHDPLTGLINRREFERSLQSLIQDVEHNASEHLLCYLDLDQFKIVNDTCGHQAGDELLKQLANTLKPLLRQSDILARLGGDEFGVLLSHCPLNQGQEIAEQLREAVCGFHFSWDGQVFAVGVSIGIVHLTQPCGDLGIMLSKADTACYLAKNLGRNRVHLHLPDSSEVKLQTDQVQWVNRIRQALNEDHFRLFCQPIMALDQADADPTHYEILLRLKDARGHMVPPGAFLPSAERFNLMPQIDLWVIRNTLAWMGGQLRGSHLDLHCAINLSGASIGHPECLQTIREQLTKHRVPAHRVCFEITETTAMADLKKAQDFIGELRTLGCKFALDDFGSGLSSFGYLRHLSVDYLKIDGIFIRELAQSPIDRAIVDSINTIGHIMGLKTVAEFVEDGATHEILHQLGVDYAQGYHLGRPQPLESLGNAHVMPR